MTRPIPYPKKPKPDWEAFGIDIMAHWPNGDIDGFDLQDIAEKHNVIIPIPGGYDPEKHGDEDGDEFGLEPGDPYFERNYKP